MWERVSIHKTWFNATQGATPGAWDYIWPDDVADGGYTLTVEATDKAGNQTPERDAGRLGLYLAG
ncbi:Ig-like domain-containing protein [Salmonella enterica]|uniref:Ig-like domain-containing protein n=1 Tax=Salmonella enterica TaxID=28901 RepID=UPI003D2F4E6F